MTISPARFFSTGILHTIKYLMFFSLISSLSGCVTQHKSFETTKNSPTQIHKKLSQDFEKSFSYAKTISLNLKRKSALPSPTYKVLITTNSKTSTYQNFNYNLPKKAHNSCNNSKNLHYRNSTGVCNNLRSPSLGSADTFFARVTPPHYGPGETVASSDRPNPRLVSSLVNKQEGLNIKCSQAVSDLFWQWGQFVDHDMTLSLPSKDPKDKQPVEIKCDKHFNPKCRKNVTMHFTRSTAKKSRGVREQINNLSHYIDGSMIYGSDKRRSKKLRTNDGTGRMATSSSGRLLPFNAPDLDNETGNRDTKNPRSFYLAGDVRVNEQVGLIAIQTLFVREHNTLALHIKKTQPKLSGEQIYQFAKTLVIAEIQHITYHEWLPVLLGGALPVYSGYDASVTPNITNEFSTAAFRFGHSMLSPKLLRLDSRWRTSKHGHLELRDAFFQPQRVEDEGGISPILRGLIYQRAQEVDLMIVDDVRNFLFRNPRAGMFDLATLNIQRGRDHGIGTLNEVRAAYSLPKYTSYSQITHNKKLAQRLQQAYGIHVGDDELKNLDLWVAGLGETPYRNALVGETFWRVMYDQFYRLRAGDRFWYQSLLPPRMQEWVNSQSLMKIIERNTDVDIPKKYLEKRNSFFSVL